MMCGAKCFQVEMKLNGTKQIKEVLARTPVAARKVIRGEYGTTVEILSVKREKRQRH